MLALFLMGLTCRTKDSGFGVEKDVSEMWLLERMSSSRLFLVPGVPIRMSKEGVGDREDKEEWVDGGERESCTRTEGGTRP